MGVHDNAGWVFMMGQNMHQQLITSVQESQAVKKLYPKLYDFLIHYPQVVELTITDDSFWYMVNLGDRPAIGLSHRLHTKIGTASFIFERAYYISHTLDSIQVLITLIPVQEGTLLIYSNRTWTEKISGLFSSIKRKIAYKIMISGMENVLKKLDVCRLPA